MIAACSLHSPKQETTLRLPLPITRAHLFEWEVLLADLTERIATKAKTHTDRGKHLDKHLRASPRVNSHHPTASTSPCSPLLPFPSAGFEGRRLFFLFHSCLSRETRESKACPTGTSVVGRGTILMWMLIFWGSSYIAQSISIFPLWVWAKRSFHLIVQDDQSSGVGLPSSGQMITVYSFCAAGENVNIQSHEFNTVMCETSCASLI